MSVFMFGSRNVSHATGSPLWARTCRAWSVRAKTALLGAVLVSTGCYDGFDPDTSELPPVAVSHVVITDDAISMQAGDDLIDLVVRPNTSLLAPGSVVIRDGVRLDPEEAGLRIPLRGHVKGDPDSWVRVRLRGDRFEGLIFKDAELWEVRQDPEGGMWLANVQFSDYLANPTGARHTCGTTEAEAEHASYADLNRQALASRCVQIDIALVADSTHVAALGGAANSENEMLARINESDGIFRTNLNYGFSVQEIITFGQSGGPAFNNPSTGVVPLQEFSSWKQSELPQRGLAHLFVARTRSGTVGLAYVGSTCSGSFATGVSNYLGNNRSSSIVVAHEIGHNFGAGHDPSGARYLMAPSVNAQANEFSPQSTQQINSHVASSSCFKPCDTDEDPPGSELFLEAECATTATGNYASAYTAEPGYSGTGHLRSAANNASSTFSESGSPDRATYTVSNVAGGNYKIWFRVDSNGSATDDSWFYRVNGGSWAMNNNHSSSTAWQWIEGASGAITLSAGTHTIAIANREDGLNIDKIAVLPATVAAPSGTGGTANNCAGARRLLLGQVPAQREVPGRRDP